MMSDTFIATLPMPPVAAAKPTGLAYALIPINWLRAGLWQVLFIQSQDNRSRWMMQQRRPRGGVFRP
jgi:hypothetical protein